MLYPHKARIQASPSPPTNRTASISTPSRAISRRWRPYSRKTPRPSPSISRWPPSTTTSILTSSPSPTPRPPAASLPLGLATWASARGTPRLTIGSASLMAALCRWSCDLSPRPPHPHRTSSREDSSSRNTYSSSASATSTV